jgi:hypothetical protein
MPNWLGIGLGLWHVRSPGDHHGLFVGDAVLMHAGAWRKLPCASEPDQARATRAGWSR